MTEQVLLKKTKIGFIGVGNMARAVLTGLVESGLIPGENIFASNRSPGKLKKLEGYKVNICQSNEEVIENSSLVVLAMKPQDLYDAVEPIASSFNEDHIVMSLAAGIRTGALKKVLPQVRNIVRVMPNTPSKVGQGVTGYCLFRPDAGLSDLIESMLQPLGMVVHAEEGEEFEALTVAASSGIGFIFELMMYWQDWIEGHGIDPAVAREMVVRTFEGASKLAASAPESHLEELQNQVVSKKGVTYAGLTSIRELEIERALRISFEKAVMRDRELGKS